MLQRWMWVLFVGLWFLPLLTVAAIDTYEFKNEEDRVRFRSLTTELRCPKCQNQDIADSNSAIATDLRNEIYRMMEEGQANDSIIEFMVARYGEFVLYRPRLSSNTYLLWFTPIALFCLGLVIVVWLSRRHSAQSSTHLSSSELNSQEQQRLKQILDNYNKTS